MLFFFILWLLLCKIVSGSRSIRAEGQPCSCESPTCTCCIFHKGTVERACVQISYDGETPALSVTLMIAGQTVYQTELSAANPPPICVSAPNVPFVSFCARFYNLQIRLSDAQVCVQLELQVAHNVAAGLDLQCLHLENRVISHRPSL